jgi:hypothetical protein
MVMRYEITDQVAFQRVIETIKSELKEKHWFTNEECCLSQHYSTDNKDYFFERIDDTNISKNIITIGYYDKNSGEEIYMFYDNIHVQYNDVIEICKSIVDKISSC